MHFLKPHDKFPPVETATTDGLLAIGGELSPQKLLEAYSQGIFPWYEEGQPVLWWSPDPRMVLFPQELKISKSMRQLLKKGIFEISFNRDFSAVIQACSHIHRSGQHGTWITPQMIGAYEKLHQKGVAQSVEVYHQGELVGGLYGIFLREKQVFCGESMFSKVSNASKIGFVHLVQELQKQGVKLIDCQIYTPHLESLGAREIPRAAFLDFLK